MPVQRFDYRLTMTTTQSTSQLVANAPSAASQPPPLQPAPSTASQPPPLQPTPSTSQPSSPPLLPSPPTLQQAPSSSSQPAAPTMPTLQAAPTPSAPTDTTIQIIQSERKKPKLVHCGFSYSYHKTRANGNILWRCDLNNKAARTKGIACNSTSLTTGDTPSSTLVYTRPHSHPPNSGKDATWNCL